MAPFYDKHHITRGPADGFRKLRIVHRARENEGAVSWLLDRRPELAQVACGPDGEQTIALAPHGTGADGFFIAAFERRA